MFWSKCNKLLVNASGELINCNNCPCGYYAVIGIKYRWLDCDTMQPDPCSWSYSVQARQIRDNVINWDYCCIEISQNVGLCGTKKGKFNCWQDCWDWDQQGNCIDGEEYCDCIQVEVYNISGCYDNYSDFQAAFFSGCGVAPDDSGQYPAIFQTSYGNTYMTSAAYDCVQNFWEKEFTKKYLLNFSIQLIPMNQGWQQSVGIEKLVVNTIKQCVDANGNWVCDADANGNCPQGTELYITEWVTGDVAGYSTGAYCNGVQGIEFLQQVGENDYSNCCASVRGVQHLPAVNAHITEKINDKQCYNSGQATTKTCKNSATQCFEIEYTSECWDNWYGSFQSASFIFEWYKFRVDRAAETPAEATGIKANLVITHTRYNKGYGCEENKTVNTTLIAINLPFGEQYKELPLATNINLLSILSTPSCDGNCNYASGSSWWQNSPHINWYGSTGEEHYTNDAWVDKYQVQIIAIDYIK